jgi:hypothetical protein
MRSWSAFVVFLTVLTALSAAVHRYLYVRHFRAHTGDRGRRLGARLAVGSAVAMPLGMFAASALPRSYASLVAPAVFFWMGLVVLALFLTIGSEPLRLAFALWSRVRRSPTIDQRRGFLAQLYSGSVGFATVGLGGYGATQVADPEVVRLRVGLRKFPAALAGFRVVQLSDIHIGPTLDGAWLERIIERVNACDPDLVAITGDLVDGKVADLREHVAPLAKLRSRHGVYFVTGNHEYYSGADAWIAEVERLGIRVLRNERVAIGQGADGFDLAGVDDFKAHQFGGGHGADLARALEGRDPSREVVLLAHQPKQAIEAARMGVGLQLSGHTHGGQLWPFGYLVRLDQPFVQGLDRLGELLVYTSRGTGYWGPPMRVGAPAEITVIELDRASIA